MENPKESIFKKPWVQSLSGVLIVVALITGILFYKSISSHIKIENGTVEAPVITISPEVSGILDQVYVKVGDDVKAGEPLAHVGAEILTSRIDGHIIVANNTPGQLFSPSQAVIKMIDPNELRVIGTIKEDSGFSKISIGDPVSFVLDAFPGEKYTGIVDEISETSKDSSVVFSISDKREVKEFTIKIKYDIELHPEFKNGMSAKIKVFNK
ncbi:MAG TPA: efflux RND transporter periplasmic adaptor subunit [Candidatus Paceibacterota bacterium]|nr:efflux RND transporter periplasmic adaptor subunit [Candidatus Paceibacterota bacterium]HPT18254.1 efflux RND transporter periplasmic adaptor subunit [Candidatus Paceibacterota bacterium]